MLSTNLRYRWVLRVLHSAWLERVVVLPSVVPIEESSWGSKRWRIAPRFEQTPRFLFQLIACQHANSFSERGVNACFGEAFVGSNMEPYLGLLAKSSSLWAGWMRCLWSCWLLVSELSNSAPEVVFRFSCRSVHNSLVDACGLNLVAAEAIKASFGNFKALKTLLVLLASCSAGCARNQFCSVGNKACIRLVHFCSVVYNELKLLGSKARLTELAKLMLLRRAVVVPLQKLNLLRRLLSLDLDLSHGLKPFCNARYRRAWLVLKRVANGFGALAGLEARYVSWFYNDSKMSLDVMFQFDASAISVSGESFKLLSSVVTTCLLASGA